MSRKMSVVVLLMMILIATLLIGSPTQQAYSKQPPSWAMKIIKNTTFSGLTRPLEGEKQEVKYLGKGAWEVNGIDDVWYFAVWRLLRSEGPDCSGWKRDLQAHVELAKIREGVYAMEIYHSWTTLSVDVPSEYKGTPFVIYEDPHLLVLNITANL